MTDKTTKLIPTVTPGLSRDISSGAVLNTSEHDFQAFQLRRRAARRNRTEIEMLREELAQLRADVEILKGKIR